MSSSYYGNNNHHHSSSSSYIESPWSDVTYQKHFMHVAHCMFFAFSDEVIWDYYPTKAIILMQNRFDGTIGFPGGTIERWESGANGETDMKSIILKGLNRELQEEMNLDTNRFEVKRQDHMVSHISSHKNGGYTYVLHFFVKELSIDEILEVESGVIESKEWGAEVFGTVRVPLFVTKDGAGFPTFMKNQFRGNSQNQLLYALKRKRILKRSELADFGF